jgi:flagellar basal-body rod modification protein FlgD
MLPVLQAIGAGLSALSALKNLTSSSTDSKLTPVAPPTAASIAQSQAAANGATSSANGLSNSNELQDRFLKLLVTQMKNQDPLNPLDNAQVTSQLAQISTVGGIDKLNGTLQSLSSSMLASQSMQSASIIGRQVYAAGSYLTLADGKSGGAVNLTQDADKVFVQITDGAGALVRTLQLGAAKAGMSSFQWDGKTDAGGTAPPGTYVFKATAAKGNTAIGAETLMMGKVGGISLGNGMRLNLEGGGDIGMADVKRIL